jgi:hypothetical protein
MREEKRGNSIYKQVYKQTYIQTNKQTNTGVPLPLGFLTEIEIYHPFRTKVSKHYGKVLVQLVKIRVAAGKYSHGDSEWE